MAPVAGDGFLAALAAERGGPSTADASAAEVDTIRKAYLAGAQHLWACIMQSLDPEAEPTPADMRRMSLIDAEMVAFRAEMACDHYPTEGSA